MSETGVHRDTASDNTAWRFVSAKELIKHLRRELEGRLSAAFLDK